MKAFTKIAWSLAILTVGSLAYAADTPLTDVQEIVSRANVVDICMRIPKITMTIISSIRVNPFSLVLF